ncbi:hypothetical protein GCM10022389_09240 [Flavobacterium cheonanense]|uniref:Type 1 periplasmic binding fold superfamily protein n=1 Tax=Flavobacterium cheonanense TaxID=706183 RepID=A0ABP7VGV6_9FLAO
MKTFKLTNKLFLSLFAFALISCSDDDNPAPVNEEEVITTVRTTLVAGSQTVTLLSRDLDGDGPNAPVVTVSGNLTAGTTYTGSVEFFNETINPADNITTEVEEEGVDHQIFYQAPASIGTFTYTDTDANGKPIGLDFTLVTASAATGNLTVTLRHLPNKSAAGVSTGNIANAGGATDAQVTYPLVVN